MEDEHLLWEVAPTDESFVVLGERFSCRQSVADFREFGPPQTPDFSWVSPKTIDALCLETGAADPEWRKPLPKKVAAFFEAAKSGDIEGMREQLCSGVRIHARDRQNRTAMWYAAQAFSTAPSEGRDRRRGGIAGNSVPSVSRFSPRVSRRRRAETSAARKP
jgi:hypothetical protein